MTIHENSTASREREKETGRSEGYRRRVFDLLSRGRPMTAREVMAHLGVDDANLVRPEITRLKADGLAHEVGKVVCNYSGRLVALFQATGKAYHDRVRVTDSMRPPGTTAMATIMRDAAAFLASAGVEPPVSGPFARALRKWTGCGGGQRTEET